MITSDIRTPDQVPAGKRPALIKDVERQTRTSKNGNQYDAYVLYLLVVFDNFIMDMKVVLPRYWNSEGILLRTAKSLGILPEIGQRFEFEKMKHMSVIAHIEEKEYQSKVFSNVVSLEKSHGKLNPLLEEWLRTQNAILEQADVLFDDDRVVDAEEIINSNSASGDHTPIQMQPVSRKPPIPGGNYPRKKAPPMMPSSNTEEYGGDEETGEPPDTELLHNF